MLRWRVLSFPSGFSASINKVLSSSLTTATDSAYSIARLLLVSIRGIVRMALWAMGFMNITITSGQVLTLRNCFQMVRVDTAFIAAQMVNSKAVRDRAYEKFKNQSVNKQFSPFATMNSTANTNLTVACAHYAACPKPAGARAFFVNFRPETLLEGFGGRTLGAQKGFPVG